MNSKNKLINQDKDHEATVNETRATDKRLFDMVYLHHLYAQTAHPNLLPNFPEQVFNNTYLRDFCKNLFVKNWKMRIT